MRVENTANIHDLLEKAKSGDQEAFSAVYKEYYSPIYKYFFSRTQKKELTEDLTQDVFLKAYGSLNSFKSTNKSPLAYFYTIARNLLIDYYRKKQPILMSDEKLVNIVSDDVDNPENHAKIKESESFIKKCLDKLTDEQKEIISLKFIDGLSNKEIAEVTEKKESAIRQMQVRALKSLGKILNDKKYEQ